jgi:hypothetical protein
MDTYMLLAVDAHAQHQRRHWLSAVQVKMVLDAIDNGDEHVQLDLIIRGASKFDRSRIRVDQIVGIFDSQGDRFDRQFFVQHTGARVRVLIDRSPFDGTIAFLYNEIALRSDAGDYRLLEPKFIESLIYEHTPKDTASNDEVGVPGSRAKKSRLPLPYEMIVANDRTIEVVNEIENFIESEKVDENGSTVVIGVVTKADQQVLSDTFALMLWDRYRKEGAERRLEIAWHYDSLAAELIASDHRMKSLANVAHVTMGVPMDDAIAQRKNDGETAPLYVVTSAADVSKNGGKAPTSAALQRLNGRISPMGVTVRLFD